jgi:hypothetical protein
MSKCKVMSFGIGRLIKLNLGICLKFFKCFSQRQIKNGVRNGKNNILFFHLACF